MLLIELASLAGPALSGALFEEIPPSENQMDTGAYLLAAYVDGKRYRVRAENHGDWYDLSAVLGLLNTVLRDRHSDLRYVSLPSGGQIAHVTVAPTAALQSTVATGLLRLDSPSAAEATGKEFERRVLERLHQQGDE
jgi:hypothetical protein